MNNTKDNPFTQDSLPIGTIVKLEDCTLKVVEGISCTNCYFRAVTEDCQTRSCSSRENSDGIGRKYILINEQEEKEIMNIKLEDGKKYVTEAGEVVTVHLVQNLDSSHPYMGSNRYAYTVDGKLYSDWKASLNDIIKTDIEVEQESEGHIHAELMLEYAKDALVSKKPWLGWEWFCDDEYGPRWITLTEQSARFEADKRYRRKPKTILINGYKVPEPLRVAPPYNTSVYIVDLSNKDNYVRDPFGCNEYAYIPLLDKGLMHLSKEAAELHAKALLSFTTTTTQE